MCRLGQLKRVKEEALLQVKALQDQGLDIDIVSSPRPPRYVLCFETLDYSGANRYPISMDWDSNL